MKQVYIGGFLALLAIYIGLALGLPPDPAVLAKHDISEMRAQLLNLTIVVPICLVYLGALYGFVRVNDYARKIHGTKEGPAFATIAAGLMLLAFGLPTRSILSSITSYAKHAQPDWLPAFVIIRQYLAIVLALAAIILIAKGSRMLYETLKSKPVNSTMAQSIYSLVAPIVLASAYTALVVAQSQSSGGNDPYYVPTWVAALTIAVPYVFIWCLGAGAAIRLHRYQLAVKGVIYKRAVDYLSKGIAVIILISILLQIMTTLSGLLNRLDLSPLLIIIYFLIACYVVGYGLVARGARQLTRIEEA